MKKSHTLLLIKSYTAIDDEYSKILNDSFSTIIESQNCNDALTFYLHYHPDVILFEAGCIGEYTPFIEKIKKSASTPIIVSLNVHEIQDTAKFLNYNFTYCMVDNNFHINLYRCIKQTIQKIELIKDLTQFQTLGNSNDAKEYEYNINKLTIPSIVCTSHIDEVQCNKAFMNAFDITQDEINRSVLAQEFLNRVELKEIIEKKDLREEHEMVIHSKKLKSKIYILKQYELYLVTFNSISNKNQIINIDLKKELIQILNRIDKNFDDYIKLQEDMIEITSSIRQFLQTNTSDRTINQWLNMNQKSIKKVEQEFDDVILEELKMHSQLSAS